tara:strand:- start:509 stop:1087 length:579 start_codon:yes stop_codon:yes gene_type:complete
MQIVNGIGVKGNFLTKDACDELINFFESNEKLQHDGILTSGVNKDIKDCIEMRYDPTEYSELYNDLVVSYLEEYTKDTGYSWMDLWYYGSRWTGAKFKKYIANVGHYNYVHQEKDGYPTLKDRLFSCLIYLNDVSTGGETIFPLHDLSAKPETGKVIIWPSGFPYIHYATMPTSNHKYAINLWLEMTYEKEH